MKDNCNLCSAQEFGLVKSELRDDKGSYKVFKCQTCGHIQLLPKPTEEDDKEFYDKNLQDKNRQKEIEYEKLKINNLFDTERHVRLIQELLKDTNCSILDIGAGYGFFVNELYRCGYKNVTGIEVSEERRNMALAHGNAYIINFNVNKPDRDIGRFDVITLFHVLEHMPNPILFLKNIKPLLYKEGIFICEVPNVREMLLDNSKEYNDFYWIRAHLNYFSDKTLFKCFRKAGYTDVQIRFQQRYGLINLCNWLTTGKPQIERPIFEIADAYKPVEQFYREYLQSAGRSDAVIAIAKV